MNLLPGDKVRWYTKKGLRRTGVVVSTRKTPRTGRAWLQVKVDPCKVSTYAGGKSLQPRQLVV
ncbi:hypothetical protein LCGC14_1879350 [marine sediment metagenome]|uniref:Hypervirulence associated protein TUDOR domain-containing protein n=1 Tax=marine sediment metagenome TaxID=412755 RepID=A0A0F9GQV6_9ZZZZ